MIVFATYTSPRPCWLEAVGTALSERREQDALLVAAVVRGDANALTRFYERYAGLVMALVLRIVRRRSEAEEILQDVFVELWRRAGQYDRGRGTVDSWVATVARSRALDAVRARNRRGGDRGVPVEEVSIPARVDDRPDSVALASERRDVVRRALEELSPEQRESLELSYFRGLSHAEIASELAIPLGTVKSRIIAAMKVLRRYLAVPAEESGA